MHNTYDITSRVAETPLWFDGYSVPRCCPFSPDRSVSIYVRQISLLEITCQTCGRLFKVAISAANFGDQIAGASLWGSIECRVLPRRRD